MLGNSSIILKNLTILNTLITYNSDILATSKALTDTIDKVFIENKIRFNVIYFDGISRESFDIINEIQKNDFCNYAIELKRTSYNVTKQSAVFVVDDEKQFHAMKNFTSFSKADFPIEVKFIVYIHKIDSIIFKRPLVQLTQNSFYDYMPFYYISQSQSQLELFTYKIINIDEGHFLKLEIVNTLNKTTLTWENTFEALKDKTKEMTGFHLLAGITYGKKYEFYNDKITGKKSGVLVDIIEAVAQNGNFSVNILDDRDLKRKWKMPMISISTIYKFEQFIKSHDFTTTFAEEQFKFVITPPKCYNSYEKLLMPFDRTTWILLILTFIIAFIIITIVNQSPKKIQNIVYGEKVQSPGYNIVSIFFGIGQVRLPDSNFPRIILMLFIMFCLIFRTAYQGKRTRDFFIKS